MLAAVALATLTGAASDGGGPHVTRSLVYGKLSSNQTVMGFKVAGVRLGMTIPEADAATAAEGFKFGWEFQGMRTYTRGMDFLEVVVAGEGASAVVERVNHRHRLTWQETAEIGARRQEVLTAYGRPALWDKHVIDWDIYDRMVYASRKTFLDEGTGSRILMCYHDWKCAKVNYGIDCRRFATPNQGAVLTVRFEGDAIYDLQNYSARYEAIARDPAFARLDVAGADCRIRAVE